MPSRQERRKTERDAAKRAPAQAGATGAAGATAAPANVRVNPGDWTTQAADSDLLFRGRGLHSFTSQLNLSALYGIRGARRGCVARVFKGVLGGV